MGESVVKGGEEEEEEEEGKETALPAIGFLPPPLPSREVDFTAAKWQPNLLLNFCALPSR